MNIFNNNLQLLETNTQNVSPHLRWLIRNAATTHCGIQNLDLIAYHQNIPTNKYAHSIPMLKGIAINLEKHFFFVFDEVKDEKDINISIRARLIRELLDSTIHEAHHLLAASILNDYDSEQLEEEKASTAGNKGSWLVAKNFDINVIQFGGILDDLLEEVIQTMREDIANTACEWKELQVYMWDNKLAYVNESKDVELNMRKFFEHMAKEDSPWIKDPRTYIDSNKPATDSPTTAGPKETIAHAEPSTTTPLTAPSQETLQSQTPVLSLTPKQQQYIQILQQQTLTSDAPETFSNEDDMCDYDKPNNTTPVHQNFENLSVPTPVINTPTTTSRPFTKDQMLICTEQVLRTLFWHIMTKCEFKNGYYKNPQAVLEPINISHIPNATELFTNMNTYNNTGGWAPRISCNGILKGVITKQNLPSYQLFLMDNQGNLCARTFIPQNPDKKTEDGSLTAGALRVREGYKRCMLLEDGGGVRVSIALEPGQHLGQEEYKLWPK